MKTVFKSLFALLFCFFPVYVFAFDLSTRTDQKFDETISDQTSTIYAAPTVIYVSQISTQSSELEKNPALWIKSLYYYSITRLHFADIPYNYIVDTNGSIYQGRSGGVGANPEMQDSTQGCVLIGYLSNDSSITNRASTAMYNLIDTLGSQWGISSVKSVGLEIASSQGQLSKLVPVSIDNDFSQSVTALMSGWSGYTSESLTYKAKVESVTYEKDVEIASKLHVTVKIKNMNDFVWLTDKDPIYISTVSGTDSEYAINGVWDSFSKPTHISNKAILPGEEATFEFDLLAQVAPGSATEQFQIEKSNTLVFQDSQFSIDFNINKGEKQLVEVNSTEYGFVNIRECQWFSCKILDTVDNGAVYILLDETDNGWMEIQYTPDTVGWVFSRYMKKI